MALFRRRSRPGINFESEKAGAKEEENGEEAGGSLCLWGEEDWVPAGRGGAGRGEAGKWRLRVQGHLRVGTAVLQSRPGRTTPVSLCFCFRGSQISLCSTIQGLPANITRLRLEGRGVSQTGNQSDSNFKTYGSRVPGRSWVTWGTLRVVNYRVSDPEACQLEQRASGKRRGRRN